MQPKLPTSKYNGCDLYGWHSSQGFQQLGVIIVFIVITVCTLLRVRHAGMLSNTWRVHRSSCMRGSALEEKEAPCLYACRNTAPCCVGCVQGCCTGDGVGAGGSI